MAIVWVTNTDLCLSVAPLRCEVLGALDPRSRIKQVALKSKEPQQALGGGTVTVWRHWAWDTGTVWGHRDCSGRCWHTQGAQASLGGNISQSPPEMEALGGFSAEFW